LKKRLEKIRKELVEKQGAGILGIRDELSDIMDRLSRIATAVRNEGLEDVAQYIDDAMVRLARARLKLRELGQK